MVTETAEKKWIVKIGLNSGGDSDMRQEVYQCFVDKLEGLGLDVELRQTGIMSNDAWGVLVEVSSPEAGSTLYEISSADDVERVISRHIASGRQIPELAVSNDSIGRMRIKDKVDSKPMSMRIDARQWKEAMDLLGVGLFLAISIVGGLAVGLWLDNMWDTRPLITITGILVGVVIGFIGTYRTISLIMNGK